MDKILDKQAKIQSTLLEFGQQNILLTSVLNQQQQQQQQKTSKSALIKDAQETQTKIQAAEEANLKKLINEMSETDQKQVIFFIK